MVGYAAAMAAGSIIGAAGVAVSGTAIMGVLTLATFGVGMAGFSKRSRAKRYQRYLQRLAGRDYCAIEELAQAVGKKKQYVVKDLQVMINKQFFREGAFDEKKTTFLGTREMYQQYLMARESMRQREEREAKQKAEEERIYGRPGMTEESRQLLKEGNAHIQHIRECNDAIPGEEISAKLYRLEEIMTRIFQQVEKQPELAPDLRKFMNYYLPTTSKLVEAYRELDAQPVEGENISRTKREIEETLDTINEAFEKLLDSFFEEKAWDISSDISVMKSMLKQDGMTGRDFTTNS
jgi:5-bromo-4-chloroindolyl phosphate hydrolysis protein